MTAQEWPFTCTHEQMDSLTALAGRIEALTDEIEETVQAATFSLDGMQEWSDFCEGASGLQRLFRYWGDYSGYVQVAKGEAHDGRNRNDR